MNHDGTDSNHPYELFYAMSQGGLEPQALQRRIAALCQIVLDLMVEVEALREERLASARAAGVSPAESRYGHAYVETARTSHNSVGPSSGLMKIYDRFYGNSRGETQRGGNTIRALVMMRRMGFSEQALDELADFVDEAMYYT